MKDDVIKLYTSTISRLRVWNWTPNSILTSVSPVYMDAPGLNVQSLSAHQRQEAHLHIKHIILMYRLFVLN